MRHRVLATSVTLLAASLVLSACTGDGSGPAGAAAVDTVRTNLSTDPSGFDPARIRAADDYIAVRPLFDTLLRRDDDNTLVGGIATGYEAISAREYLFTIRDDAACADGTPVTPGVVADSLRYFADPQTASPGRTLALGNATTTVTADDAAGTVRVVLDRDWSDLPTGMALPHTGIICPAGLADLDGLRAGTVAGAFSGPYTLTRSEPAVSYELTLRPDYAAWPRFATPLTGVAPATIVFVPVSDASTVGTQLQAGDLDIASISDENANRFVDAEGFTTTTVAQLTDYLLFNQRPGSVFAERPDLRRAVGQAVDAEAFADINTGGRGEPIRSLSSPNVACVNQDATLLPPLDPTAARSVLAGTRIRLVASNAQPAGAEYVAEVLRGAGAEVALSVLDNANWSSLTTSASTEWDLTVQGDINIMGTLVSSLLRVMGPPAEEGGRNKTGLVQDGYPAVLEAMATTDADARCAALARAQQASLGDVDAVPLSTRPENADRRGRVLHPGLRRLSRLRHAAHRGVNP